MGKQKTKPGEGTIEEEEAFVRGGGSGLAPIVKKQLEQEAYAEAEADLLASGGEKGGKRRKLDGDVASGDGGGDEENAFFHRLALQGKLPKFVELLKFRSLSRGCKLWGAVIEVSPRNLVVSLPHGLRGHVAYSEASDWLHDQSKKVAAAEAETEAGAGGADKGSGGKKRKATAASGGSALPPLSEMFSIGQLVRATVVGLHTGGAEGGEKGGKKGGKAAGGKGGGNKKRVDLSLRVSKMNAGLGPEAMREGLVLPACVRSVEDHGFTLALGVKCVTGFLPKKAAAVAGRVLGPGMLLEVVVPPDGGPKPAGGASSVLAVICDPEAVAGAMAREYDGLNIGSLLPGQLVTARVRNVLSDGLLCSFFTYFSGTVDPFHLGTDMPADWRKQFSPNQRLRARILFVDPAAKRVGLTLQRHLLAHTLPPNFPFLGQVFEAATVRRVDEGLGLLLELPPGGPGGAAPLTPGFAHISNISEEKVEELGKCFRPGQKLRARVLGFRPMDGLAVLSLKPSVVASHILSLADIRPGMAVPATVMRVEEHGLLVAITSSIRALVPVLHASDLGSAKALCKYKEGQKVAGRVLTVDPGSKKVTVTLKPSLVCSRLPPITCLQDALPGGRSHGMVTGAQDLGVFVSFFGGMAGLAHMSECGLAPGQKPGGSFHAGQVVKCRVLGADPTHKGLKLSLVTRAKKTANEGSGAAAAEGEGVAPTSAVAAAAGGDGGKGEDSMAAAGLGSYEAGDLVQGIITSVHTEEVDGKAVASYFELAVTPAVPAGAAVVSAGAGPGRLEVAHLADHPAAQAALVAALKVGSQLGPLLVLQRLENVKQLRLSRKSSLLAAAKAALLPSSVEAVAEGALLSGYVASVTSDAVFVRFLGCLTGRAGLAQLSDTFVSDPHLFFKEGQSVVAAVVQVDAGQRRFSVALKQSLCGNRAAANLQSLFSDLEAAEKLTDCGEATTVDWSAFAIGSVVSGEVHAAKEYGLLCDLQAHADVVGLVALHQVPEGTCKEPGTSVRAVVLDANKRDGIVDLSLQPHLVQAAQAAAAAAAEGQPMKKKHKKAAAGGKMQQQLKEGQQVDVTVELLKPEEGYCVVSLPAPDSSNGNGSGGRPLLGFLPITDLNLPHQQHQQAQHQFAAGQQLTASVAALDSPTTGGRLVLSVTLTGKPMKVAGRSTAAGAAGGKGQQAMARQAQQQQPAIGSCVEATVGAVHMMHAELALDGGFHGRLYITEAGNPLPELRTGSNLSVVVLGRVQTAEGRRHALLECSSRPAVVAAAKAGEGLPRSSHLSWASFKPGQQLQGFVQEVERGYVWCAFSPSIRGRAFAAQAASSIEECERLGKRFKLGQPVQATVVHVDRQRHALDVSLMPSAAAVATAAVPAAGSVVLGRITAVGGGGVRVQLSAHSGGRVALTDIHDGLVQQALAGLEAGQYCLAAVLGPDLASSNSGGGKGRSKDCSKDDGSQLLLSLRPSAGGQCAAHSAAAAAEQGDMPDVADGLLLPQVLKPGQRAVGYVKSASQAGVFVCLARDLDARIRLSQLADGFVESPGDVFPEGRLVAGQVLKVEGPKVELTLRSRKVAPSLKLLEENQVVRGRVKRIAHFGVFVELEGQPGGAVTGLAHVSEVADNFVKELGELFTPGQRVVARVLKVDNATGRLSLGLKPSYFEDVSDIEGSDRNKDASGDDFDAELEAAGNSSDKDTVEGEEGGSSDGGEQVQLQQQESKEDEGFDLDEDLAAADSGSSEEGEE